MASFPLSPATSCLHPAFHSHHLFISPAELVMSMVASSLPPCPLYEDPTCFLNVWLILFLR